jgi:hypothetical protein
MTLKRTFRLAASLRSTRAKSGKACPAVDARSVAVFPRGQTRSVCAEIRLKILKVSPSGARSSVVPTVERQRIFPALRSSATSVPHGGLLQGMPSFESAILRVIAKGAPICRPKSTPGGASKSSASALGINLTIWMAWVVLA